MNIEYARDKNMICKPYNKTPLLGMDALAKAAYAAEKQMSFYLNRAFTADPNIQVYHDLRLLLPLGHAVVDDDAVQIDHLVIHRHGMVIIESKSVSSEISIENAEFKRLWNGRYEGMPSPINQAKRQGEGLRAILNHNRGQLREKKVLGLFRGTFRACPIEILVAISDGGIIRRTGRDVPEVLKADAIVDAVRAIIDKHKRGASRLSPEKESADAGLYILTDVELSRIRDFLLRADLPMTFPQNSAQHSSASQPVVRAPIRDWRGIMKAADAASREFIADQSRGAQTFDMLLEAHPGDGMIYFFRAKAHEDVGALDAAARDYADALRLFSQSKWKKEALAGLNRVGKSK